MDKYYTPTIEEFHIGFEFEEEFNNPNWNKMVRPPKDNYEWVKLKLDTSHSISRITSKLKQEKVRVKYLDIEDIESLGWKLSHEQNSQNPKGFYFTYVFRKSGMYLDFYPNRKDKITVHNGGHYEDYNCLFTGQVKNKSELKKLLKMIGV